jgi:hypothetical protein
MLPVDRLFGRISEKSDVTVETISKTFLTRSATHLFPLCAPVGLSNCAVCLSLARTYLSTVIAYIKEEKAKAFFACREYNMHHTYFNAGLESETCFSALQDICAISRAGVIVLSNRDLLQRRLFTLRVDLL